MMINCQLAAGFSFMTVNAGNFIGSMFAFSILFNYPWGRSSMTGEAVSSVSCKRWRGGVRLVMDTPLCKNITRSNGDN